MNSIQELDRVVLERPWNNPYITGLAFRAPLFGQDRADAKPRPIWPNLDRYVALSQKQDYTGLSGLAANIVNGEPGTTDRSKLRLLQASSILRNTAWYPGPHLMEVVDSAPKLMVSDNLREIREAAAGAVKNAAHHKGPHIPKAIEFALTDWPKPSIRVTYDCVRTITYAARHSKALLQTEAVKSFLEAESRHANLVIADQATETLAELFGHAA
jgi:hypothetical protein